MKNIKGFTMIEGLLILVIVGILGGIGWYVWDTRNKTSDTLANADSANSSAIKYVKNEKDPTADWVSYSNTEGSFSLKHPRTWVKASNLELCNPGLLLIGANADSVGRCASESFGQMSVASVAGDSSKEAELKDGYTKIVRTSARANGVTGVVMSAEASGQVENEFGIGGGLPAGTKVNTYIFYANGRTYTATYIKLSSYPDALSDFNLMVTKTLKFSS